MGLVLGMMGYSFNSELYGLKTMFTLSPTGIMISAVYIFKGIVAYGLWTEKDWAVRLAIGDAILGIFICVISMVILPFINMTDDHFRVTFRMEIVALIPYLVKMRSIKEDWEDIGSGIKHSVNS